MSTTASYGGIEIQNCQTVIFEQRSEKDTSNTDVIFQRFKTRVIGHIHLQSLAIHGFTTAPGKSTVAEAYRSVTDAMMRQRQEFAYKIEGTTLISARPVDSSGSAQYNNDLDNGPTPTHFQILKVIGNKVLECEFEIECCLIGKDVGTMDVLSNRWSVQDIIDENFVTTRIWRGKLRVASAQRKSGPHWFRYLCIPPMNRGFLRKRMEFTSAANGLELDYVVEDVQTSNAPPAPATSWSGTHRVKAANMGDEGMGTYYALNLTLEAPTNVPKTQLIDLAAAVGRDRIGYVSRENKSFVLMDYEVADNLGQNSVTLSMTVFSPGYVVDLAELDATKIGTPLKLPDYDRFAGRIPKDFGTASTVGLFVAYLQSLGANPSTKFAIGAGTSGAIENKQTSKEGGDGTVVETFESPTLPPFTAAPKQGPYSSEHSGQGPYTLYVLEIKTHLDPLRVVCPIAKSSSGSSSSSSSASQDTVVVVPIGLGVSKRTITVEAVRVGSPPAMPSPKDFTDKNGIKYYLIDNTIISPQAPSFSMDGAKVIWSMKSRFEFAMSRPLGQNDKLEMGALPWDTSTLDGNSISLEIFKSGIGNQGT